MMNKILFLFRAYERDRNLLTFITYRLKTITISITVLKKIVFSQINKKINKYNKERDTMRFKKAYSLSLSLSCFVA